MKHRIVRAASSFLIVVCAWAAFTEHSWCATPSSDSNSQGSSSNAVDSPQSSPVDNSSPADEVTIPGPLRSFLRMAAISQKISPEEVLPLLARNVVVNGYQGGKPTEFLILLNWYMDQAR